MGYRAQFYLSLEDGRRFNRSIVDGLIDVIGRAFKRCPLPCTWSQTDLSLKAKDSKIWPDLDRGAFKGLPQLVPQMWIANYGKCLSGSQPGLALAEVNPPLLGLKGSWISSDSDEPFLPADKLYRDGLLRCFGFT